LISLLLLAAMMRIGGSDAPAGGIIASACALLQAVSGNGKAQRKKKGKKPFAPSAPNMQQMQASNTQPAW